MQRSVTAGEVPPVITPAPRRGRAPTINSEAFELYLRGRLLVEQRGEGMRDALGCFERAIELDPEFAPSHAGMAYGFNLFGLYHALPARDAFARARDAAERALVIDPTEALALVMRAHTALWFEWDIRGAEMRARRALELAPALYLAHDCLGFALAAQGRFDESIAAMQSARALDPLKDYATYDLGWVMMLAGRWQQAIAELRQAVARHPESSEMHRVYGYGLFYSGREREALAEFRRVLELNPANQWGPPNLAQALAACGETAAARRLVAEIERRAPEQPMPLVGLAVAHHWLGDDDAALAWLERAIDARDYWLIMLRYDPSMIRLREKPRYASLMRRVTSEADRV
jgi:tetratricopeptide (TPR) repeat protein